MKRDYMILDYGSFSLIMKKKSAMKEKNQIKLWLFSGQSIKLESAPFLMYTAKKLSHECRLASKLGVEMKKKCR